VLTESQSYKISSRLFPDLHYYAEKQKIGQLLRESGLAIQCLSPGASIQSRKEAFENHAETFARLLEVSHPLPVYGVVLTV
jgi:hypothetical protein